MYRAFARRCTHSAYATVGASTATLVSSSSATLASSTATFSVAPHQQRRYLANRRQFNISVDDAKLLWEQMEERQREIEAEKNETATEVKLESPPKWVGAVEEQQEAKAAEGKAAETVKAANSESTAEADTDTTSMSDPAATSDASVTKTVEVTNDANTAADGGFLYGGVRNDADIAKREKAVRDLYDKATVGDVAVARGAMSFMRPEEEFALRLQRAAAKNVQQGPYVGSRAVDVEIHDVDSRSRRAVERVPQMDAPFEANETSFRRLPMRARLPDEFTLRHLFPMRTKLQIEWFYADCVDADAQDIGNPNPNGIKYGAIFPDNYDPNKTYPYMIVLSDNRGMELDFEDFCTNLIERDEFAIGLKEQQWVFLAPMINVKHSIMFPNEAVVARFVDWACLKYKMEHNKPHLIGKGVGGYLALRCGVEHKALAVSITAILGRLGSAYRPFDRPQEKIKNMANTHTLIYTPGGMRKLDWIYKFKGLMDLSKISPPCRNIHFAEVRDQQVYYAINPNEFCNYLLYFRRHCMHQSVAAPSGGERQRVVSDTDDFREYSGAADGTAKEAEDMLGTVTYEWLAGRNSATNESGKSKVSQDGTVA